MGVHKSIGRYGRGYLFYRKAVKGFWVGLGYVNGAVHEYQG